MWISCYLTTGEAIDINTNLILAMHTNGTGGTTIVMMGGGFNPTVIEKMGKLHEKMTAKEERQLGTFAEEDDRRMRNGLPFSDWFGSPKSP